MLAQIQTSGRFRLTGDPERSRPMVDPTRSP
jgi:hypothetical protein